MYKPQVNIEQVELKYLIKHTDDRGFFEELIRKSDSIFKEGFGQLARSLMHQDVIKAWHIHKKQIDWWFCARGVMKAVLCDLRENSKSKNALMEVYMGENYFNGILKIPSGVAHGLKVLQGPCELFYVTSSEYDPKEEGRISYNDPLIKYDWLKRTEIK